MNYLDAVKNFVIDYQNASDDAERRALMQRALADARAAGGTPTERAAAIETIARLVRGYIVKSGYNVEKAEALLGADAPEVVKLRGDYQRLLNSVGDAITDGLAKFQERLNNEGAEGGAK